MSDRTRQHFIPSSLLEIMIINFTAYLPNCAKHHFQADRPKIYTSPKYIFLISSWVIPISHCKDSDYDLHVRALIQRRTHACFVVVVVVFTCEEITHADFPVTPLH